MRHLVTSLSGDTNVVSGGNGGIEPHRDRTTDRTTVVLHCHDLARLAASSHGGPSAFAFASVLAIAPTRDVTALLVLRRHSPSALYVI